MSARIGAEVGLYLDSAKQINPGDAVVSASTGRSYLVTACREQTRGAHVGRQHLRAVVFASTDDLPADPDRAVIPFLWYARPRHR